MHLISHKINHEVEAFIKGIVHQTELNCHLLSFIQTKENILRNVRNQTDLVTNEWGENTHISKYLLLCSTE